MHDTSLPDEGRTVVLDVRPILAMGQEPFDTIMSAADDIETGGVLELTAPFEPLPLYEVMARRGFAHQTDEHAAAEFVVRFVQTDITLESTVSDVHERFPATAPVIAEAGLDLCCGGGHTIEFAAGAHGLEPLSLLQDLQLAAVAT
jgi:uncharacterized protein (DUF2249 family)